MDNELLDGFYLESLLVEPLKGAISNANHSAHLPSKSIEVLLLLAKNPRRLVTREQIIEKVWGDGHGSTDALSHAIGEIRHALDDHADDPQFIQTVPTRGYRLLVEPVAAGDPANEEALARSQRPRFWQALLRHGVLQASAAYLVAGWLLIQVADASFETIGLPPWSEPFVTFMVIGGFPIVIVLAWFLEFAEGRMTRDRGDQTSGLFQGLERNYLAILAAYGVAAIGASIYHATVGFEVIQTSTITSTEKPAERELIPVVDNSLAVLKFLNIGGDPVTQAFSDGLSEDILDGLARFPGLFVSSRGDSWSLPSNASSDVVRRRLRVAHFIEGSVRFVGDKLRVVVQLIDSDSGFHVFSRSFELEIKEVGEMQKEVTTLVVSNLKLAVDESPGNYSTIYDTTTEDDAYILFLKGRSALFRPRTREDIDEAIQYFTEALAIDPDYPAAHAGICAAYTSLYELQQDTGQVPLAEAACAKALAVAPRLSLVINTVARLYRRTGNFSEAEAMYLAALEINPQDAVALLGLALIRRREQRFDEAERHMLRAIEVQPGNWTSINALGNMYFRRGRYVDAIAEYRRVVYLNPENHVALGNLGSANMMTGDFEAARDAISRSLELEENATFYSNLGIMHYYLGEVDAAIAAHERAVALVPTFGGSWVNLADTLQFGGRNAVALDAYREGGRLSLEQLGVNSEDIESLTYLAWSKAMLGESEEAITHIERALALDPADPYSHYYNALVRVRLGDPEAAIDAAELALKNGYPAVLLAAEPILGDLHQESRFARLLATNEIGGEQE